MRYIFIGWTHPRTPILFNLGFNNLLILVVPPDVGHDLLIPGPAHLSAPVEAFITLEDNLHHDFIEYDDRQHFPVGDL